MGRTITDNVDLKISEEMLQRRTGNQLQMNLDGYWTAIVQQGGGASGCINQVIVLPSNRVPQQTFKK
jgi:hypothetical protein